MRGAKRWLSLFVGASFLYAGCQQAPPDIPPRVEIPVTNQPGRASNDDMAFRVPSDREPRPRQAPAPKQGVTIVEGNERGVMTCPSLFAGEMAIPSTRLVPMTRPSAEGDCILRAEGDSAIPPVKRRVPLRAGQPMVIQWP